MRSEVFEKIRQNRLHYIEEVFLSEQVHNDGLNVAKEEANEPGLEVKDDSDVQIQETEAIKVSEIANDIRTFLFSLHISIMGIVAKVKNLFSKMAGSVNEFGAQLAEGFYERTAGFFED